jgi:hypothetical protein
MLVQEQVTYSGMRLLLYFPLTCTLAHIWGFRHVQPVYVGDKLSLAGNRKSRARELDDPDPLYVAVEQIETHIYGYKSNLAETKALILIPVSPTGSPNLASLA